jgi:hypothetical protein
MNLSYASISICHKETQSLPSLHLVNRMVAKSGAVLVWNIVHET